MANHAKRNSKSQLLSDQENEFVFNVLGKGCFVSDFFISALCLPVSDQTLATGVAQLFVVQCPRRKRQWIKKCCGVVCFVKDNPKRSYFIRLYDVQNQQMLWEQELYTKFKYNTPKEFFHTFEAHDCHVGLNFASEDEAAIFKKVIEGKLLERHTKRLEREERKLENNPVTFAPAEEREVPCTLTITASSQEPEEKPPDEPPKMRNKKSKKKRKFTKDDVGKPLDFRHVSHMSWGIEDGPHMEKLDSDMKELLKQIGIVEKSQVDNETMDFIYQFVDKHGGASVVREDFAWHIPAELSHPPGETVDITKHFPAAPSHPVDTMTTNEKLPIVPSHPADKTAVSDKPLPVVSTHIGGSHLVPLSGVKVFDATSVIRPEHILKHPPVRPPPPATKPPPIVRPTILGSKPPPQGPKPSPPESKPPSPGPKPPPPGPKPPPPGTKISPPGIKPPPPRIRPSSPISKIPPGTKSHTVLEHSSLYPYKQNQDHSTKVTEPDNSEATTLVPKVPDRSISPHIQRPPTLTINVQTPPTPVNVPASALSSNIPDPPLPPPPNIPAPTSSSPLAVPSEILAEMELPTANNSRAGLLNEIHTFQGSSLRHVQTGHQVSGRTGLLSEIRAGASLKHVDHAKEEPAPTKRGSIAAALMSQLLKRKTIVQFSDNEYSSDEFDDDWDD